MYAAPDVKAPAATVADDDADATDCSVACNAPDESTHRTVAPVVNRSRYPVCSKADWCCHEKPCAAA